MNILLLATHLNTGGITSYLLTLCRGFKKRGHNIYIASSGGEARDKFIALGCRHIDIPVKTKSEASPKILISFFKLRKAIKSEKIDIIHAHTRVTQVLAFLLKQSEGVKFISTCHGFFKPRFLRKIFPCWGIKVIAISNQVKEHLIHDFNIKEADIIVVNNGIDLEKFRIQSREYKVQKKRALGLGDEPAIGIIARLSDVKGHVYLIEAMKIVVKSFKEAKLFIVGEGKTKEELEGRVKFLGLDNNVVFIPEVSDTRDVLYALDIFAMPSLKEGLGLGLMEAMASGLAVVGSNTGGIKTLINPGFNGLLVEPCDTQGLAAGLLDLINNPQKRESFGQNASSFINQNFSDDKMILGTEKAYLQCLNEKS